MNNGGVKYIYLLTATAPRLRPFSRVQNRHGTGPRFPNIRHPHATPPVIVSAPFWSWGLLSVLEMVNQAWFWRGSRQFWGDVIIAKFGQAWLSECWNFFNLDFFASGFFFSEWDVREKYACAMNTVEVSIHPLYWKIHLNTRNSIQNKFMITSSYECFVLLMLWFQISQSLKALKTMFMWGCLTEIRRMAVQPSLAPY